MPSGKLRNSYQDLEVWQEAVSLATAVWDLTRTFPVQEQFGMSRQLRRAAASIPANIAEGYGRMSKGDYVRFLGIANGSLKETESHLILSRRVGLIGKEQEERLLGQARRVGRLLYGLRQAVRKSC